MLSLEDALGLVVGRAKLMSEKCALNETGMLAVRMPPTELAEYLKQSPEYDRLSVACHNRFVHRCWSVCRTILT